jgi:hypothetical protein
MARQAMLAEQPGDHIAKWLETSRRLDSSDARNLLAATLYRIHPRVYEIFLHIRAAAQPADAEQVAEAEAHPFADLLPGSAPYDNDTTHMR